MSGMNSIDEKFIRRIVREELARYELLLNKEIASHCLEQAMNSADRRTKFIKSVIDTILLPNADEDQMESQATQEAEGEIEGWDG